MLAQLDTAYLATRPYKIWSRLLSYALFEGRPLTTRGQWINPLVFAQLRTWQRLPQVKSVEKPIFILGTGRSGTTILGVLLSMHRDVGFLNEPKALWHVIHPHEDVIGSYDRGSSRYRLGMSEATPDRCRTAHRLFGAYLATTFSRRVVDKYPELIFRVPFVQSIFPDAKFIFLVRNGWDTCTSIDSWSKQHTTGRIGEVHDWWGVNRRKWHLMIEELIAPDPFFAGRLDSIRNFERHTDMAATEWVVTMREGLRNMRKADGAMHLLKYEDLVQQPTATLERLLTFCELPADDTFMRFALDKLTATRPYPPFAIDPAILPLFNQTLADLGYPA